MKISRKKTVEPSRQKTRVRIAVSGAEGSFSEEAGLLYAKKNRMSAKLMFAIDMEGVLQTIDRKKAKIGIFPVVNSRGGLVNMAFEAMGNHLFNYIDDFSLEVRHCLMVKTGITKKDIKKIATHPQAIAQCEKYIRKNFPKTQIIDWQDTAKAARDLAKGVLPKDTAVIAPARCAELYGLKLLEKGIQDYHPNLTTFIVVTK